VFKSDCIILIPKIFPFPFIFLTHLRACNWF
jgi:hypothetical protein